MILIEDNLKLVLNSVQYMNETFIHHNQQLTPNYVMPILEQFMPIDLMQIQEELIQINLNISLY